MILTLQRRSDTRLSVELTDDEGNVIHQRLINRYNEKDIKFLSNLTQQANTDVRACLNAACENKINDKYQPIVAECNPPESLIQSITGSSSDNLSVNNFAVYVRDINQLRKFAQSFVNHEPSHALETAFTTDLALREPIIEWDDRKRLCCLDVDYHDLSLESRPRYEALRSLATKIKPQPYCWHPSHRGGCKLYYSATPMYTAEELAAVAGIHWLQLDPRATFDLTKSTRHPRYARSLDNAPPPVHEGSKIQMSYGLGDLAPVKRLLMQELDQEDVLEFLEQKGWKIGDTLEHDECPISPSKDSKLNVYVGDKGIYCHKCHAAGLGANGSGFMPYAAMIGGTDSRITTMVRNFCHLEHARLVLASMFPNVATPVLDMVYKVMLKSVHTPDDPRVALAMISGKGYVRSRGMWVSTDGRSKVEHGLPAFARSLPSVLIPAENGFGVNVTKHTTFMNTGELGEHGYPDISFIRGCKIFNQFLSGRDKSVYHVVPRPEFAKRPPKYLIESKRHPDPWGLLDHEFPGISPDYVKLLIATKGASEGRLAQCPFLLVTGPSGSGKSTTPHIAAGICGDKAEEPVFNISQDRFRGALMDAASVSSFIVVNEIFKTADLNRMSHIQALTPMLSLTEDSRSHVLYVGSVAFGRLPVFVLTDVAIPKDVETDVQIARRFFYYHLPKRNYWEDTLSTKGIRPHEFRLLSEEHNLAADSILSQVIDEFFQTPMTLRQIANKLSAESLETWSEDLVNKKVHMSEFYKLVLAAPKLTGSDARRYTAEKGWKKIDRNVSSPMLSVWNDLCDGGHPEFWVRSRSIEGEDWSKLLGVPFPVVCDIRNFQGNIVYVRFRSGDSAKRPRWINGSPVE